MKLKQENIVFIVDYPFLCAVWATTALPISCGVITCQLLGTERLMKFASLIIAMTFLLKTHAVSSNRLLGRAAGEVRQLPC